MTDQTMIERVARAIYEEDDPWHKAWPWPDLNEKQGSPDQYRRIAIAAINALPALLDELERKTKALEEVAQYCDGPLRFHDGDAAFQMEAIAAAALKGEPS